MLILNKKKIEAALSESLQSFVDEVESWMTSTPTSFNDEQKEEIKFLMKHVFYTFSVFKEAIEQLKE